MATKKTKGAATTRNMKPFYIALAAIAVVGIGAILYSRSGGEATTEFVDMAQLAEGAALVEQVERVGRASFRLGDQIAPLGRGHPRQKVTRIRACPAAARLL